MQWKPNVTVCAIVEDNERFLIIEENSDGAIVLNQPSGHLEENETLVEAVKREVLEETAYEFEPEYLIGTYLYYSPAAAITYLRFCFLGKCIQHHPDKKLDDGILRAFWASRQELVNAGDKLRSPLVLRCIDDYLAGQKFDLSCLQDELSEFKR